MYLMEYGLTIQETLLIGGDQIMQVSDWLHGTSIIIRFSEKKLKAHTVFIDLDIVIPELSIEPYALTIF